MSLDSWKHSTWWSKGSPPESNGSSHLNSAVSLATVKRLGFLAKAGREVRADDTKVALRAGPLRDTPLTESTMACTENTTLVFASNLGANKMGAAIQASCAATEIMTSS
jgi:hypothetical protein